LRAEFEDRENKASPQFSHVESCIRFRVLLSVYAVVEAQAEKEKILKGKGRKKEKENLQPWI